MESIRLRHGGETSRQLGSPQFWRHLTVSAKAPGFAEKLEPGGAGAPQYNQSSRTLKPLILWTKESRNG